MISKGWPAVLAFLNTSKYPASLIRTGAVDSRLFANHPLMPGPAPAGYLWSLPLLYLVWAIVVVMLYFPRRWYAALKARNKNVWLSYL